MNQKRDENKDKNAAERMAVLKSTMSDAAKLVALLSLEGEEAKETLAEILNKSVRTIEPLMTEARRFGYVKPRNRVYANSRISDTRIDVENEVGIEVATRAPKELPNGNSYTNPALHAGGCGGNYEVEGLNGSTGSFVTQLACMLAGPLGNPNFAEARAFFADNVPIFGPEKVKNGFAEWQAKVRMNLVRPTPRSLVGFFKRASTCAEPIHEKSLIEVWDEQVARGELQ